MCLCHRKAELERKRQKEEEARKKQEAEDKKAAVRLLYRQVICLKQ